MSTDKMIEDAMRIGERNKITIELIKNWCRHVEVVITGGVGMVEETTGLPIGMRGIRCKHARAPSFSGMQMDRIALDFYDRNCEGCTYRESVALPNLTELLRARDEERRTQDEASKLATARSMGALQRRQESRRPLAEAHDHAKRSLAKLIDAFDRDPSSKNADILVEATRALSAGVDEEVERALFDLAEAGPPRAEVALQLLEPTTKDKQRLCKVALVLVGISSVANRIVERDLEQSLATAAAETIPRLIRHAAPTRFPGLAHDHGDVGPLAAVLKVNPAAVETELRRSLRADDKETRRAAAVALHDLVLGGSIDLGVKLIDDLLASFERPDDGYDDGPAARRAAATLATIFQVKPDETEARIERAVPVPHGGQATLLGIIETYSNVSQAGGDACLPLRRRATEWLAAQLARLPADTEVLDRLCYFWAHECPHDPTILADVLDTMIGTAALAQQELETPTISQIVEPQPDFLKALDAQARQRGLQNTTDAALRAVRVVATEHPDAVTRQRGFESILAALGAVNEKQDRWQATLTRLLGDVLGEAARAPQVLPRVYHSMTNGSVRVRAAAVEAYRRIVKTLGVQGVPMLLHQLVVATLQDPYLMVHQEALEAVEDGALPESLLGEVRPIALASFRSLAGERDSLAALAANVVLLTSTRNGLALSGKLADAILGDQLEAETLRSNSSVAAVGPHAQSCTWLPRRGTSGVPGSRG